MYYCGSCECLSHYLLRKRDAICLDYIEDAVWYNVAESQYGCLRRVHQDVLALWSGHSVKVDYISSINEPNNRLSHLALKKAWRYLRRTVLRSSTFYYLHYRTVLR